MMPNEVLRAIRGRRSVRRYKPDPIPKEDLNQVLDAARWAPSWANTQCCRFVVVKDKEIRAKLAETLSPKNPAVNACYEAPVVIVGCALRGRSGYKRGEAVTERGDWFMFDMGIALQNIALAAHSLGLGTVHVGYFDFKKVGEVLNLPEEIEAVEMMPLGYPDQEPTPPPRKELSDLIYCDRYEGKELDLHKNHIENSFGQGSLNPSS